MIRNEKQLALVREQLERAEKALKCISDEVRPKSEVRFLLMAESYVEMIQQLHGEIVSGNLRTSPKVGRQTMDVEVIEGEDMDEGERQTTC
jgi:hypothetical protein